VKNGILWLVFGCMLPCGALGQTEAPKDFDTIKQVLQRNVESAEQALLAATEAMPEEKYSFALASVNLIWPLLIFSFGPTLW
jgi:hypothetical protein